jgi:hypothetical protein
MEVPNETIQKNGSTSKDSSSEEAGASDERAPGRL